ncbi:MAG: PIG-L family deacetylase [Trueperaceae bacterium]|nr:MAG: PIG-L family deacetylase [Trueperaceae bacterium]
MNLLAIFAHPDDESFSCGGTLARYADAGASVHLICATRGEEGEIVHPDIDPESDMATLRTAELEDACRALGIAPPIFLDYHDSGFPITVGEKNPKAFMNADLLAVERSLLEHIEALKPEVILTFDPHGSYGHVDHIVIHRAAIGAFWSAGSVMQPAPRRLFFTARSSEQIRAMQAVQSSTTLDHLEPELYGVSEDSFAAVIDIGDYVEHKLAALKAHRSQFGAGERFDAMRERAPQRFLRERFTLGGLRGAFPEAPVDDLFAGLG